MKKFGLSFFLVAALLLSGADAPAQGARSDAPQPLPKREKVVVGMPGKLLMNASVMVAKGLGEFEKENLEVEYSIQKPSDGLVLLSTGRIDVLTSQPSAAFFNAVAQGSEVKLVMPTGVLAPKTGFWASNAWLRGRTYQPGMLKGATIASYGSKGALDGFAMSLELAKAGYTLNDIQWKQMGLSDQLIALENGAIDLALLLDPVWRKADESKVSFVIPFPADLTGTFFFGRNLLVERRAVGEAFTRAIARTVRTHLQGAYGSNPKVGAVLAAELQMSEEQVRTMTGGIKFPPDMPVRGDLSDVAQKAFFAVPGVLNYQSPLPAERVIDLGFLEAAGVRGAAK